MAITTDQIKALRDETNVSVMQCKKALEQADGDMEKARLILRELSAASASKKADRELGAGTVASYIHAAGSVGVLVQLMCETDFVSKNDDFKKVASDIALHIAAMSPEFLKVEDAPEGTEKEVVLFEQPFVKNPDITIKGVLEEATQKFGERVEITRFERFAI